MITFKYLAAAALLWSAASGVYAQKLIIDDCEIDLDTSQSVRFEGGDIIATSDNGIPCGQPPGDPTVDLQANPTSIDEGGQVTLSWTTTNATGCTPTLGSGTQWTSTNITGPTGSRSFTLTADTTFRLSCTNGQTTVQDQVTVAVQGQTNDPQCDGVAEPLRYDVGTPSSFATAHGSAWPGTTRAFIEINNDISGSTAESRYAALRFTNNTGNLSSGSYFTTGTIGGGGAKIFSISRCRGDFSPPDSDCVIAHASGGLKWNTGPKIFGRCQLQEGETYYMNIAFAQSQETIDESTCRNANSFLNECTALVEPQELAINPQ